METVSISKFKATCLELLKNVKQTGQPILVTLRGEPIAQVVPPQIDRDEQRWLGMSRGTGTIDGDIVSPTGESWDVAGEAET
jgi:prevent-host-death family protein